MILWYIRVSTDKQTTENQRFEIKEFAIKNELVIDKWIMETISSTQELDKRKLGKLLKKLKAGDILVASELSRLGRNLLQVMSILHHCMASEVQVWTIKDNYRLGAEYSIKGFGICFWPVGGNRTQFDIAADERSSVAAEIGGTGAGAPAGKKKR